VARKTCTRELKLQAPRMLTEQGLSVSEVARQLGVGENCLRVWRAAAKDRGEAAFPGPGNRSAEQEELRRLRAEVQRLPAARLRRVAALAALGQRLRPDRQRQRISSAVDQLVRRARHLP
jgi:transposase